MPSATALSGAVRSAFSALDDDAIPWKTLVLYLILAVYAFETYLSLRQYKVYSYPSPPLSLVNHVDIKTYNKSQSYGRDKARFAFVAGFWGLLNALAIVHFDAMPAVWTWAGAVLQRLGRTPTEIPQSILFTLLFSAIRTLLDLPLSYYSHFVLEEKHGFNKMTLSTFLLDFVKNLGIGAVLLSPLIAGLIAIIRWAGTDGFVFWVLVFMLGFQMLAQFLYPKVIQPLFNKLEPLPAGALRSRVLALASSLRFPLAKIYQIDGSRRSAHSNAYFFGVLPWANKHIVIFDTLIAKSTCSEIEAVLAHELGHWKHSDPAKLLILAQAQIGLTFALFAGFIGNVSLFRSFGFHVGSTGPGSATYLPIIIGLELFQMVLSPTDAVLKFLTNSAVRSMEYAADAFAARLERPAFAEAHVQELTSEQARRDAERARLEVRKGEAAAEGEGEGEGATSEDDGVKPAAAGKKDSSAADPEKKDARPTLEAELAQTATPYRELLAQALIKLHVQNLSTMHYDALYSAYHHSHPTLPERLAALERIASEGKKDE